MCYNSVEYSETRLIRLGIFTPGLECKLPKEIDVIIKMSKQKRSVH